MTHVGKKITLRTSGRFGGFLGATQFRLAFPSFRNVAEKRSKEITALGNNRVRNCDFDRKLSPRAVKSREFEPLIHNRSFAGFEKPSKTGAMCFSKRGRNNHVAKWLTNRFLARPSEDCDGLGVPTHYLAVGIHADECIVSCVQKQSRTSFALSKLFDGLSPVSIRKRHDDEIRERQCEILFVGSPSALTADVLEAQDSDSGIFLSEWDIEHCPNT